jgi:hypothetical protein
MAAICCGSRGGVELSGWQSIEGSNTLTDSFGSVDSFLAAYAADPPRVHFSARGEHKSVALTVDSSRGRTTEISVALPDFFQIHEVFAALDTVSPHSMSDVFRRPQQDARLSSLMSHEDQQSSDTTEHTSILKLHWERLTAEEFERVLFNIVAEAAGYMNPQWLMHTNAPDRGRDVSVERVTNDTLSGVRTQRVIVQAKHWLSKSVRPLDVSEALTGIPSWEPPRVHVLVITTTGRFTADAVNWIEKHNDVGKQPIIEMWPDSHIELLLRGRPGLVAQFGLH